MDVEALAVSKISTMVGRCPHLKAYVSTNDKTPFTDGYIDIYTQPRRSKADWKGRVSVQVKGRTLRSKRNWSPTHNVARTDLLAYQKDSGVLYFIVTVDRKSAHCTAYYALLSPFAIQWILDQEQGVRQTIPVTLKAFPHDPRSIESIVALALKTRDQSLNLGFDPVLFERIRSLTLHTPSSLTFDAPVTLAPGANDFALVLNTADGLSVPLAGELRIFPPDYVKSSIDLQVRSGAVAYEGSTIKRVDHETFELEISQGLKITIKEAPSGRTADVDLTLEERLEDRIKSLEFYVALLDTCSIEFNGKQSPFEISRSNHETELRDHLKSLRALADLLGHLGVDTGIIDLSQINDAQARQLRILHRSLMQEEEITYTSAKPSRLIQQVGPWRLLLLLSPGSTPEKWRFVDPFSAEIRRQLRWAEADGTALESFPVTAYDLVEDEHLGTVVNMRLDEIVGAYEAIAEFPKTYDLANRRVLALIAAADTSELRDELLNAAKRLNDWLISQQGEEPYHLINRWQIAARFGALSAYQRNGIRELRRRAVRSGIDNADLLQLACAILLGDGEEVADLVRQLPNDQLHQMQGWPIWRLCPRLAGNPLQFEHSA